MNTKLTLILYELNSSSVEHHSPLVTLVKGIEDKHSMNMKKEIDYIFVIFSSFHTLISINPAFD